MRSSTHRRDKYAAKVRGFVIPGQGDRYRNNIMPRMKLEQCVKAAGVTPMLQFSYVAYLEELLKHDAARRPEEAAGIKNKWLNRGLLDALLVSTAACMGIGVLPYEPEPPPVCAWDWKRQLVFTGNISATDLDNFPVLVHLTNANFDFNKAQANGEDIRFMDSDTCPTDGTPLKHEIELWDKAGLNAWVWVKVPRINGGTVNDFIYVYYGNGVVGDGQDAINVWDNNFRAVWHMRGNGTATIPDSTQYNKDGTKGGIGVPANSAAGQINGCQEFDGDNDIISRNEDLFQNFTSFTIECWFRMETTGAYQGLLDNVQDIGNTHSIFFQSRSGAAGDPAYLQVHTLPYVVHTTTTVGAMPFNTWKYIVAHWDGSQIRIYVDGTPDGAPVACVGGLFAPGGNTNLGLYSAATPIYDYKGRVDEVRISDTNRSGDWIMAQYKNMNETLITYGAEQAV